MKKLITLFICAVFTISTIAQEKEEPTKKETFDFIVKMISKGQNCAVNNYDVDTSEINFTFDNLIQNKIKLIDLIEVNDIKYEEYFKSYQVYFKFKTVVEKAIRERGGWLKQNDNFNSTSVYFENKSDAEKMSKALLHYIKLNGSSGSFFDD